MIEKQYCDDLTLLRESFVNGASAIKGFVYGQIRDVPYDVDVLADGLADAIANGDELGKNAYGSALMVRYWHIVTLLKSKGEVFRLDYGEATSLLYSIIHTVCSNAPWRNPSNVGVYGKKNGAEKCINVAIETKFSTYATSRYKGSSAILDVNGICERVDDWGLFFVTHKGGETDDERLRKDEFADIVKHMVCRGELVEAVIAHELVYGDVFMDRAYTKTFVVDEKETVGRFSDPEFSKTKLLRRIVGMTDGELSQIGSMYGCNVEKLLTAVDGLRYRSRRSMSNKVTQALSNIGKNEELREFVLYSR